MTDVSYIDTLDKNRQNIRLGIEDFTAYLKEKIIPKYGKSKIVFACIGTDKCIGDCLGPMVGSMLENRGYNVVGTLEYPMHAINLSSRIDEMNKKYPGYFVIGVDACLGSAECIGSTSYNTGSIRPGKGVGKNLPHVGDISIVGVVDTIDSSDMFSIRSIRLNLVYKVACDIVTSLDSIFNVKKGTPQSNTTKSKKGKIKDKAQNPEVATSMYNIFSD
jgi:putative sporulation protein YyaC